SSKLMIVPNLGTGQLVLSREPMQGIPEKKTGAPVAGAGAPSRGSPGHPASKSTPGNASASASSSSKCGPTSDYRARRRSRNAILPREGPARSGDDGRIE